MAFAKKSKAKKHKTKAVSTEDVEVIEPEVIETVAIEPDEVLTRKSSSKSKPTETSLARTDPVARYMQEVSRYPLLSREQEKELAIKYYDTKDPEAAQALITANLRFVVKVANEYSKFGAKLIDLIQEGNVGLMHAVKEFNPYKGVKLITYAVWWIRGYIQEYLMKQYSMVKIGTTQNQRKLFYRLQKEREKMDRLGASTVIKQLSGKLDIPEAEIEVMAQRMQGRDVSLNTPLDSEDKTTLMDFQATPSDENIDDTLVHLEEIEDLKEVIDDLRPSLNERELDLLNNRILSDEPLTLQEIGDKNGVTREAVRQMENRIIKKIKDRVLSLV